MKLARTLLAAAILTGAALAAPNLLPGPPGICSGMELGEAAKPLDAAFKDLPKEKTAEVLLKLLDENRAHAIVRMEAIRRAMFAREARAEALDEMALQITTRALLAKDADRAGALFDAGYFIYMSSVLTEGATRSLARQEEIPGYALIARSLAILDDPEVHVGACYATLPLMHAGKDDPRHAKYAALFRGHAERAAASADPLVSANLRYVANFENFTLDQLRAKPAGTTAAR
jgi:hypothetical protein